MDFNFTAGSNLHNRLVEIGLPVFRIPEVLWFSEAIIYFALQSKSSTRTLSGLMHKKLSRFKAIGLIEHIILRKNRQTLQRQVRQKLTFELTNQIAMSNELADKIADYLVSHYFTNLLKVLATAPNPSKQLLLFFSGSKPASKIFTS